jgi:hypothetical protein
VMEARQIDFAWTIVDWRTFDPASPLTTFPGDAAPGTKAPSALEVSHCSGSAAAQWASTVY